MSLSILFLLNTMCFDLRSECLSTIGFYGHRRNFLHHRWTLISSGTGLGIIKKLSLITVRLRENVPDYVLASYCIRRFLHLDAWLNLISGELLLLWCDLWLIFFHLSNSSQFFLTSFPFIVLLDASPEPNGESLTMLQIVNPVSVIWLLCHQCAMIKWSLLYFFNERIIEGHLLLRCSERFLAMRMLFDYTLITGRSKLARSLTLMIKLVWLRSFTFRLHNRWFGWWCGRDWWWR